MTNKNKQKATQAPPPAFLRNVINKHEESPEKLVENADEMEQVLTELSQSDAWEYLKKFIDLKRKELAQGVREASDGSISLEEVGFRYLAADQVNTFATQLISFVEKYARAKRADRDSGGQDKAKPDQTWYAHRQIDKRTASMY